MTQEQALDILKTGANVFLTGEPGAGKTHTINRYVAYLRAHGVEPAITASTGIAATHIHGMTIHSWSGIGIKKFLSPHDLDKIASTEHTVRRIRKTKVLIIDEVSMLDAATLDAVDQVCRAIMQTEAPFGGIQVVLVGDFFQLPPVTRAGEMVAFSFEAAAWRAMDPVICYLSEQHRQDDGAFLDLLTAIRANACTPAHTAFLDARHINQVTLPEKTITEMFPHNSDVDALNARKLAELSSDEEVYEMDSYGTEAAVQALKKGCLSPEELRLKEGALVMCTKNNKEKGFVNGTLGEIVRFVPGMRFPVIRTLEGRMITVEPMDWAIETDGKVRARITQIPLRLAWAITVHKSQGMSLDAAVMDLSGVFEYGQGYVALSRVRSQSGLYLRGWHPRALEVHPDILKKDEEFRTAAAAAREAFGAMLPADLKKLHDAFVRAIGGSLEASARLVKKDTHDETCALIGEHETIKGLAEARGLTTGTIIAHIEKLIDRQSIEPAAALKFVNAELKEISDDVQKIFMKYEGKLTPVFGHYNGKYSFDDLRLARAVFGSRK